MTIWPFWGEKQFSDVYENIYIRSFVEDWFGIVDVIAREINSLKRDLKLILDVGCGEGHTTKQILDRITGEYICDLLEPDADALTSAQTFLAVENSIGEIFPQALAEFESNKKYDVIFTSHTNYYWSIDENDYQQQLKKLLDLLNDGGKLLILTLPQESGHYKIMRHQVYPEFNYAEYIIDFYKNLKMPVSVQELRMRIFIGDMFTTNNRYDVKLLYRFIHNSDSFPNQSETEEFLNKIKEVQKDGYIDFKDNLIIVSK